jgi:hypothetical protein
MNYLRSTLTLALLGTCLTSAHAADTVAPPASLAEAITGGKLLLNFRPRYEYVDQDGKTDQANAFTLRTLVGWQTLEWNHLSAKIELINVARLNDNYFDNARGVANAAKSAQYPTVADPDNTDINQLYLDFSGVPGTKIRLGRQSVKLDNVRFIGNVEFRQVMQVFDGVALTNTSLPDTEVYLAYFDRVKQVSTKLRQDNTTIAHVAYKLNPTATLTGYAYLYDQEHVAATADNSTRTLGLRADGSHKINDQWKLLYTAEYAKQDDYKGGSSLIDNHYYRIGGGVGYGNWQLRVDQELLSGNSGGKAFQTPLGTNHLFQGWADLFLTTPNEGVRDTFITAGGKLFDVNLLAEYHWIDSDRDFRTPAGVLTGSSYGKELDLSAGYSYGKNWSGKVEYARFTEDDNYLVAATGAATARKRDTDKLWLVGIYNF